MEGDEDVKGIGVSGSDEVVELFEECGSCAVRVGKILTGGVQIG